MKNRRIGTVILGWTLVISPVLLTWVNHLLYQSKQPAGLTLLVDNILSTISIYPRGLPLFFTYLPKSMIEIGFKFILLWTIIVFLCGVGILLLKNIARILLIIISALEVMIFVIFRIVLLSKPYPAMENYTTGNTFIDILASLNFNILIILVPLIYIIYLTRPKVKEQFK